MWHLLLEWICHRDNKHKNFGTIRVSSYHISRYKMCFERCSVSVRWTQRKMQSVGGEMFPWQAVIWCGSINMLGSSVYFVPSGKNRSSSQGKRWRLQPACIISHKSASRSHWRRHSVGGASGIAMATHAEWRRWRQLKGREAAIGWRLQWCVPLNIRGVWVEEKKRRRRRTQKPSFEASTHIPSTNRPHTHTHTHTHIHTPSLFVRSTIQPIEIIWFTTLPSWFQKEWKIVFPPFPVPSYFFLAGLHFGCGVLVANH